MNTNNLETLLGRYADGSITPEEEEQLNLLTHRQAVWGGAMHRSATLRRRRHAIVGTVAALLVAVGLAVVSNLQSPTRTGSLPDGPMVAKNNPSAPTEVPAPPVQPKAEAVKPVETIATVEPIEAIETIATVESIEPVVHVEAAPSTDPIVACNTQCSPDSVINEIWSFLKA